MNALRLTWAWWNRQSTWRRHLLLDPLILASWLLLALAVGTADHHFSGWYVPTTRYVVTQAPLYADYLRIAGPFYAGDTAKCEKIARRYGPLAYCMLMDRKRGDELFDARVWEDLLKSK